MTDNQISSSQSADPISVRDVREERPEKMRKVESRKQYGGTYAQFVNDVSGMISLDKAQMTYVPFFGLVSHMIWEAMDLIKCGRKSSGAMLKLISYDVAIMASYIFYRRIFELMQIGGTRVTGHSEILQKLRDLVPDETLIPGFLIESLKAFSYFTHPHFEYGVFPAITDSCFHKDLFLSKECIHRLPNIPALFRGLQSFLSNKSLNLNNPAANAPTTAPEGSLHVYKDVMPFFAHPAPLATLKSTLDQVRSRRPPLEASDVADADDAYDIKDFFCFDTADKYYSELTDNWQLFCSYFIAPCRYSDLPTTGSAAGGVIAYFQGTNSSYKHHRLLIRGNLKLEGENLLQVMFTAPNAAFPFMTTISEEAKLPQLTSTFWHEDTPIYGRDSPCWARAHAAYVGTFFNEGGAPVSTL